MSFKQSIKGVVNSVGDISFFGTNNTPKQSVVIFQLGYRNQFGEQIGKDELWQLNLIGKTVENLNINENWEGKKVECEVWFSGNGFQKQDNSMGYGINANLVSIKEIEPVASQPANNQPVDVSATPGEDDDLPF